MKFPSVAFAIVVTLAAVAPATADDGLRDLCPDRPGKATSACTLDADHFQLESDIFNATFQHQNGVTTDIWTIANPNLKYGVTADFDIEVNLAPLVLVRTHDSNAGTSQTIGGIGDLIVHGKWAVIGNGGSDFALVLEPTLKIPTARTGIGNGAVEGGLIIPLAYSLGDGWSIGATPEIDVLKNNLDDGRHANLINVIAVNRTIGSNISLGAEVWEDTNFDPASTMQSWSFDIAGSWQPDGETQLDAGLNLGLNRNIPGAQVYTGVSRRF